MKRKPRFAAALFAVAAIAALSLAGCSTVPFPNIDGKGIEPKTLPGPETHTLIYGQVGFPPSLFSDGSGLFVSYAQINPDVEPMVLKAGTNRKGFWLMPVPKNSVIHAYYYSYTAGRTTYYCHLGIQKGLDMTISADKTGLLCAGDYVFRADTANVKPGEFPREGFFNDPLDAKSEYAVLKAMLEDYRKTAWESLIVARMEELKK